MNWRKSLKERNERGHRRREMEGGVGEEKWRGCRREETEGGVEGEKWMKV